jgi:hypothetical protein
LFEGRGREEGGRNDCVRRELRRKNARGRKKQLGNTSPPDNHIIGRHTFTSCSGKKKGATISSNAG